MPALHREMQIATALETVIFLTTGLKISHDPTEFLFLGRGKGQSGVHRGIVSRKRVDACLHVA